MSPSRGERDARVKILVNSCISKVNVIRVRVSRKFCSARPRDGVGMQLASSEEQ